MASYSTGHTGSADNTRAEIADYILREIMSGQLSFGEKIFENKYVERFGVSRTPVREAMLSLASLGVVTVRPRSGSYVFSFTRTSLQHLFDVRLLLETGGVRLANAAQRACLIDRLEARMVNLQRDASEPGEFDIFSEHDTEFHAALVEAAQNDRLTTMYHPVKVCTAAARSRLAKSQSITDTANGHHAAIIDALRADNIEKFEDVLSDHLAWVVGMLMRVDELFTPEP